MEIENQQEITVRKRQQEIVGILESFASRSDGDSDGDGEQQIYEFRLKQEQPVAGSTYIIEFVRDFKGLPKAQFKAGDRISVTGLEARYMAKNEGALTYFAWDPEKITNLVTGISYRRKRQ